MDFGIYIFLFNAHNNHKHNNLYAYQISLTQHRLIDLTPINTNPSHILLFHTKVLKSNNLKNTLLQNIHMFKNVC